MTASIADPRPLSFINSRKWACYLLGLAFAGFFDGILFHQILQWHSLLSNLEGDIFKDLRFRVLTDGLFHAVMYFIGGFGLYLLWRTRKEFSAPGASRLFVGSLLIGFGAWHILDAVVNHWLLGLHRIKQASGYVLAWDLAFFALGIACVTAGILIRRSEGKGGSLHGLKAAVVAFAVISAGFLSAVPWQNSKAVTVVFRPGVTISEVVEAANAVDGRLMWSNRDGDMWVFAVENGKNTWSLYNHGAWFVGGSFLGIGCFPAAAKSA